MSSSGMLRHVALVRTDVSEECGASIIRVTRIGKLTVNIVHSSPIHVILMVEALSSSETSVLTRATRSNISEEAILNNVDCYMKSGVFWDVTPCGSCKNRLFGGS
jgi:hypothetical protein